MGLIYIDGFGLIDSTEIPNYWRNPIGFFGHIDTTRYRTAPGCISPNAQGIYRGVAETGLGTPVTQYGYYNSGGVQTRLVIGAAVRFPDSLRNSFIFRFGRTNPFDLGNPTTFNTQCSLNLLADGTLAVTVGVFNTIVGLCDPTVTVSANSYYYIEFKVEITHGGFAEVHINGQTVFSGALDLQVLADPGADTFGISGVGGGEEVLYDDLYLLTPDGLPNYVDFLGDSAVLESMPTSDGRADFITHGSASHWQNVDEVPPDGDTTYNQSTGVGSGDTYGTPGMDLSDTILAAQAWCVVEDPDGLFTPFHPLIRVGGVDTFDPINNTTANPAYTPLQTVYPADPVNVIAWTPANFNASSYGVEEGT